jgi:hypothetical protein
MQPQELYFQGPMAQFWIVIYAEYQRLYAALGREPFRFFSPLGSLGGRISEYAPKETDKILITFFDHGHGLDVISLEVEFSRIKEMVCLTITDSDSTDYVLYEGYGKSALSRWNEVRSALKKSGLLVDPLAHYQPKKKRGMQLGTEHKLQQLRELRLEAIKNNRPIPKKKAAMDRVHITYRTWVDHDRELWAGWDDESYR